MTIHEIPTTMKKLFFHKSQDIEGQTFDAINHVIEFENFRYPHSGFVGMNWKTYSTIGEIYYMYEVETLSERIVETIADFAPKGTYKVGKRVPYVFVGVGWGESVILPEKAVQILKGELIPA